MCLVFVYRYGAILEKFEKQDHTLMGRIKGCIIDSAPVAAPDPQVNLLCLLLYIFYYRHYQQDKLCSGTICCYQHYTSIVLLFQVFI